MTKQRAKWFRTRNVLIPWGCDYAYQNAELMGVKQQLPVQPNTKGYSSTYLAMGFAHPLQESVVFFCGAPAACGNTQGYSSTYLAMGFANVRAGTQRRRAVFGYLPEH